MRELMTIYQDAARAKALADSVTVDDASADAMGQLECALSRLHDDMLALLHCQVIETR